MRRRSRVKVRFKKVKATVAYVIVSIYLHSEILSHHKTEPI